MLENKYFTKKEILISFKERVEKGDENRRLRYVLASWSNAYASRDYISNKEQASDAFYDYAESLNYDPYALSDYLNSNTYFYYTHYLNPIEECDELEIALIWDCLEEVNDKYGSIKLGKVKDKVLKWIDEQLTKVSDSELQNIKVENY